MSQAQKTTDHDTIRRWTEARAGSPAVVRGTDSQGSGVLRIAFTASEADLERISWEVFFQRFEDNKLAFLHQDQTEDGKPSRFFKLVSRD